VAYMVVEIDRLYYSKQLKLKINLSCRAQDPFCQNTSEYIKKFREKHEHTKYSYIYAEVERICKCTHTSPFVPACSDMYTVD
jgi:hypothetical protein